MNLYCQSCNANHELSTLDVERLVYGIQAELAEALANDHVGDPYFSLFKGKDAYEANRCLKDHLTMSGDCEGYGEHTNILIDNRRALAEIGRCDECGGDRPLTRVKCRICEDLP